MPLLTVKDLSVEYRTPGSPVCAVDRVSFEVEPGEIVALVGESGSGKTSVALALTRLLPPTARMSGEVLIKGVDLSNASARTLLTVRGGTIAYVFQEPSTSLNPVLSIGRQLIEAIELHTQARGQAAKKTAIEWRDRVGIASAQERISAYPHELSGGMQQRVMLATALAGHPSLLVADEPTTALDVTIQVQLLRLLRDLQRTLQLSVLLISHDLLAIERLAHRVGVMFAGRLVEMGPVQQVFNQPTDPYTTELLRARALFASFLP